MKKAVILLCLMLLFHDFSAHGADFKGMDSCVQKTSERVNGRNSTPTKYLPVSACNILDKDLHIRKLASEDPNLEFINSTTLIRILVVRVDFVDLPSRFSDVALIHNLTIEISKFYKVMSRESTNFNWTISESVIRMPQSLSDYDAGSRYNINNIVNVIQDTQSIVFQQYQPLFFDFLIVAPPSTLSKNQISTSISIIKSDLVPISSTILAADFWRGDRAWSIPAHELGHALGLLDLYDYSAAFETAIEPSRYKKQFQYMDIYDLMNWPTGLAPELSAWNRWQLGYLSVDEIRCLPAWKTKTYLEPIESMNSQIKALFFKVNDYQILVMENRRSIGFDSRMPAPAQGLIIYLVDFQVFTGKGPLKLLKLERGLNRRSSFVLNLSPSHNSLEIKIDSYVDINGCAVVTVNL